MDQGRFFDQFFGIVFGTVVVVSQDWFFWIFENLCSKVQIPFYGPLAADDSFFRVSVLPKRFFRMML
jgi:hypothetical protein